MIIFSINKISIYAPFILGVLFVTPFLFFPKIFGVFLGEDYINDANYKKTILMILITTVLMLYKQGIARIMIMNNLMWFSFFSNLIWGIVLLTTFQLMSIKDARVFAFSYFLAYLFNILVIVPYYTYKKIIKKEYIINLKVIIVWLLFGLCGVTLYFEDYQNIYKFVLLILVMITFAVLFFKIIKQDNI